jgi:hypothetical protein
VVVLDEPLESRALVVAGGRVTIYDDLPSDVGERLTRLEGLASGRGDS